MIPSTQCPYEVKIWIKQAWDENPERRPTFSEILGLFSKIFEIWFLGWNMTL